MPKDAQELAIILLDENRQLSATVRRQLELLRSSRKVIDDSISMLETCASLTEQLVECYSNLTTNTVPKGSRMLRKVRREQ
jgi:hypothetical protein